MSATKTTTGYQVEFRHKDSDHWSVLAATLYETLQDARETIVNATSSFLPLRYRIVRVTITATREVVE